MGQQGRRDLDSGEVTSLEKGTCLGELGMGVVQSNTLLKP